jgi:predicted ABC-type transport system involved in lysophospholipase L1 biosynthesis ATPase subunit
VERLDRSERARIRNREIGFIFQAFNLIGDLTVFENVELPLTYRHVPGTERKRMVREALEKVGMAHRQKHYPRSYPAASSSAWPWRGRWLASRQFCWRTSLRAISIQRTVKR